MANAAQQDIPEVIDGVRLDKADLKVINKQLEAYGAQPAENAQQGIQFLVKAIEEQKLLDEVMADCRTCGGGSDGRLDCCPFCGDDGMEQPAATAPAAEVPTIAGVKAAKPKPDKKAVAPKPPKAQKAAQKSAVTPAPTPADVVTTTATEVIPAGALDEAVARVNAMKRQAVVSYWELGRAIVQIYDKRLFTQRLDDKGVPKYKSWSQFCLVELEMSPGHSYKLMDIACTFSEEDVATVGVAKLGLIARLDPATRDEILAKAKDGLPLSKVAQEVRALAGTGVRSPEGREFRGGATGAKGFRGKPEGAKTGIDTRKKKADAKARAAAEKLLAPGKNQVTVVTMLERQEVPLFARPKKGEQVRAMGLEQDAFGTIEFVNGVECLIRLVRKSKGLSLMVEFRRQSK